MKKITLITLLSVLIFSSCQKELEREYKNPESTDPKVEQKIPGMFSSNLYQWKFYVKDYGEWWWQLNGGSGVAGYSQLVQRYITPRYAWFSDFNDPNTMGMGDGLNWFNDYYVRMKDWKLMKVELELLSGQEKADSEIYVMLSTVQKDWGALRTVDFYNDMPYSEAFKGDEGVFFPKYDNPKDVYKSVLNEMKAIAAAIPGVYGKMSEAAKNQFKIQDIALKGDPTAWVQYINFLRLKYAVRMSGVDADFAKTHIAEAITNLPTKDLTWEIPNKLELPGGGTWQRGLYEVSYGSFIPNVIMKRLNLGTTKYEEGTDDPRLPVMAQPTKFNDYRGVSMDCDAQEAPYIAGEKYYPYGDNIVSSLAQDAKSKYNLATYPWNEWPAIMATLAEADLLLAEVNLKSLATTPKTAADYMKDAVIHSTNYWYFINGISTKWLDQPLIHPKKPADAVITGYADIVKANFTAQSGVEDKMEVIMQQKYIHINIVEPYELFAELRRTGHPLLEPFKFKGVVMKPQPQRLRYPSSELQLNTENFLKVANQDNYTSPIFWVPADKVGKSYYLNSPL